MPVEPDIDDAGPTREHNGSAAFRHIELNSPNPIMWSVCRSVEREEVDTQ